MRAASAAARPALAAVLVIAALAAGCAKPRAVPTPPEPPSLSPLEQLTRDITAATQSPGVQHGVWGVVVHSLDRDERLFAMNPTTLLVPASAAKLVAVATAADAVGWDYRYVTTLSATTPVDASGHAGEPGVLTGDLVVTGSGDPSIGGRGGEDLDAWVEAVKAAGIRRIDGRVIGDDNAIEEPRPALAWAWDDLGYRTGAIFGALNYAENRMVVRVSPGPAPGRIAPAGADPSAADRPLVSRVVTGEPGSQQLLWPEQRPGEPFLTIAGSIPVDSPTVELIVSAGNPTMWFASALRSRLIAAGIPVLGEAVDVDDLDTPVDRWSLHTIHEHRSPPLAEIIRPLLKESINVYAEAVLRLNAPAGSFPTNDAALAGLQQRLAAWGLAPYAQQLVDGSGLSRRDVISADALVAVLRRMHDPRDTSPWMLALPVAGVDGSLRTRMAGTAAEGNVRAKTGTMSNVRSLAGYVSTRDGERLAFAIMVNNFEGTGAEAHAAIDRIAVTLAEFSRN